MLAPALLAWVAYRSVSRALDAEFERRLVNLAAATATQIGAQDIEDATLLGDEGAGFANLQVQLEALRAAAGLANASAFDTAGVVLYDCRGPEHLRQPTRLDTLARAAVDAALQGRPVASGRFVARGATLRAGLAPVIAPGGAVVAAVAVEAPIAYDAVLGDLRRALAIGWGILAVAVAGLAALRLRQLADSERLERRLARAETLAGMGRLTATLAHEIKNPLAIIRGSAERLGRLDPESRRMADFVIEEADRLSRTVARYLQFARPEAAPGGGGDAIAALAATLALLEGEAAQRRVTIARAPGPDAAAVGLDNESLKQVYLNALLNAMDAMPEGGRIEVACAAARGRIEVRIADEGPGLTDEQLARAGTPFHTTKPQGSGLGLFLSRRLVGAAGGEVTLGNRAGTRGAEWALRLPMVPVRRGGGGGPAAPDAAGGAERRE